MYIPTLKRWIRIGQLDRKVLGFYISAEENYGLVHKLDDKLHPKYKNKENGFFLGS